MQQVLKVRTDTIDGDDSGNEWVVYYVVYQTEDDDGHVCFDLYEDDGQGNGDLVARGYNLRSMRSMALRLGMWVEWKG